MVERVPERGIVLRDYETVHGDDADIFLSSFGAPPFKCRHRPLEVERRCADAKDVYPIAHGWRRTAFGPWIHLLISSVDVVTNVQPASDGARAS
jgi:integrase